MSWLPAVASDRAAREAVEALEAYAVYKMGQYPQAYQRFLKLAHKRNIQGMLNVANMLQAGLGVAPDASGALTWYLKAAEQGSAIGMFYSGKAYLLGVGAELDLSAAQYWLRRASAAGSSEAQLELGKLLMRAGDLETGLNWIEQAAHSGDIFAQRYLSSRSLALTDAGSVSATDRALIEAAWDSIDRSLSQLNAPGVVYYLAADASIKIRLPQAQNWLQLNRQGLRDFWQLTFNRAQTYTVMRGDKQYRHGANGIQVDSVVLESLGNANNLEQLQLDETAVVSIHDNRVVIDSLSIIVTRR